MILLYFLDLPFMVRICGRHIVQGKLSTELSTGNRKVVLIHRVIHSLMFGATWRRAGAWCRPRHLTPRSKGSPGNLAAAASSVDQTVRQIRSVRQVGDNYRSTIHAVRGDSKYLQTLGSFGDR